MGNCAVTYAFEREPCMSLRPPHQDPPVPSNRYGHRRSIAEPPWQCSCPAWVLRPRLRRLSFFLVKELGTPLPIAGLYYLTNLTEQIAGYLVSNHSDRTGERLILFRLCALAGFAGWAPIPLSTEVWMPFLISRRRVAFSVAASAPL